MKGIVENHWLWGILHLNDLRKTPQISMGLCIEAAKWGGELSETNQAEDRFVLLKRFMPLFSHQ